MNMQLKKSQHDVSPLNQARIAASDRQAGKSRRSQALLAAAGTDAPTRRWFVATVETGADRAVGETLVLAGIECWLPHVTVTPPRRGGRGKAERPSYTKLAFPGYVFVRVAATEDAWAGLASVKGVVAMLGASGRPLPVSGEVVTCLLSYLADDKAAIDILTNAVKEGDSVVVKDGPFVSHPGTVAKLDDRGFAIIDILIFGRSTRVQLDLVQLKKV